jgi:DNA-binding transcriptional LysR family regulator
MPKAPDRFVPSRLKTQQLALLVQLGEHRSVLHAANAVYMTQPAASKMLAQIEESMGVALFVRHARGVEPTRYGEILVRHARNALFELKHAYDEVLALRSGLSGKATIGAEVTSAMSLVPLAVANLKRQFPELLVNIEMDFSEPLVQRVREGKLDIALARINNAVDLTGLQYEPLEEGQMAIVTRAGHPLGDKAGLDWSDLVVQTWILPPQGNVLRSRLTVFLLERGLASPRQVVETASLPVITRLLQLSDMIAPLPEEVVRPYCDSDLLALLPIKLDVLLGAAGIITRSDHELSPGARAMLHALREAAGFDLRSVDAGSES